MSFQTLLNNLLLLKKLLPPLFESKRQKSNEISKSSLTQLVFEALNS